MALCGCLPNYIRTKSPKAKGWSYSTIYRMVRFYEMYSTDGFKQTVSRYGMQNYLVGTDPKKLPSKDGEIVSFEMTQFDGCVHPRSTSGLEGKAHLPERQCV